jgi:tRNA U34 5-methylaminomethyl-2-thiouridine-forming methyltransferase MnmC
MSIQIRYTNDNSATLYSDIFKECYHSTAGAVTESFHVFIDAGLRALNRKKIKVFEAGFGTGLNAFLSFQEAKKRDLIIDYTAIELYPPEKPILEKLSQTYPFLSDISIFQAMHQTDWNQDTKISESFSLTRILDNLLTASIGEEYDLVYFDAFSPDAQPELWTEEVFKKMFNAMSPGGLLTTYCAKGTVRRNMQKAGFVIERLPGLPPKREMLRAGR